MAQKRFTRSRRERVLGGVCGGLAEYFDADPSLVRLLVIFLSLVTALGPAIIVYLAAWIIVPER